MATVADALKSARSLLNDDGAITWSDALLIPKLQEAHRELLLELELNGIPVTKEVSSVITVSAGDTDLGYDQPDDIVEPIGMMERDVGGSNGDFFPMTEVSKIPMVEPGITLGVWAWTEETIRFVGATSDREVILRYHKSIPTPSINTAVLGFIFAELYIGPRVASLAMASVGDQKRSDVFEGLARGNLAKIIQMNVTGQQGMPKRRLPYRRGARRYRVVR